MSAGLCLIARACDTEFELPKLQALVSTPWVSSDAALPGARSGGGKAKKTSGDAQSSIDERHTLLVHPLPQSVAPWHTLPYCKREVNLADDNVGLSSAHLLSAAR